METLGRIDRGPLIGKNAHRPLEVLPPGGLPPAIALQLLAQKKVHPSCHYGGNPRHAPGRIFLDRRLLSFSMIFIPKKSNSD